MGQSKKNCMINPDFDHFRDSIRYMMSSLPKKIDPMVSRTYMPGYDMGDWLTLKADKEIHTILQITNIYNDSPMQGFYKTTKEDLYIYYTVVVVKEEAEVVNTQGLKRMLRWELDRWNNNRITYSELLKNFRPLTETEKLLYAKEE